MAAVRSGKEALIAKNSQGCLKLASVKKINGVSGNFMGVEVADIDYEAEVVAQQHCYVFPSSTFSATPIASPGATELDKGGTKGISGTAHLVKTDNGWKASTI